MKKRETIKKIEYILNKYKKKNDSYIQELRKTYDEYLELNSKDKVTNELYLVHMDDLCKIIEDSYSGGLTIALMVIILILTSFISFKFYLKYVEVKDNLEKQIVRANAETNMKVTYINLEDFSVFPVKDDNYTSQKPTTINIKSASSNYNGELVYRIYMIPKNDKFKSNEIISKKDIKYAFNLTSGNTEIMKLSNATEKNNRILLFEGTMNSNDEVNLDYYMWLDADKEIDVNKKFDFTFYIDGYVK